VAEPLNFDGNKAVPEEAIRRWMGAEARDFLLEPLVSFLQRRRHHLTSLIGQDHKAVFGTGQPRGIIAYTAVARVKALASVARRPARVGVNREKKMNFFP
jgi:hypothetical protein